MTDMSPRTPCSDRSAHQRVPSHRRCASGATIGTFAVADFHQGAQPPCCIPDAVYIAATEIMPPSTETLLSHGSHPYTVRATVGDAAAAGTRGVSGSTTRSIRGRIWAGCRDCAWPGVTCGAARHWSRCDCPAAPWPRPPPFQDPRRPAAARQCLSDHWRSIGSLLVQVLGRLAMQCMVQFGHQVLEALDDLLEIGRLALERAVLAQRSGDSIALVLGVGRQVDIRQGRHAPCIH